MSALDTQVGGMNQDEIIAMAREAGFRTGHIDLTTGEPIPFIAPASGTSCMWEVLRFAALVAAKERERLFGEGMQFDGQMLLQLTRWEDGQCFAAAAHFSAEQTHCGPDDLLTNAVERLEDSLDACIAAAIRTRDRNQATGVVTGGVQ